MTDCMLMPHCRFRTKLSLKMFNCTKYDDNFLCLDAVIIAKHCCVLYDCADPAWFGCAPPLQVALDYVEGELKEPVARDLLKMPAFAELVQRLRGGSQASHPKLHKLHEVLLHHFAAVRPGEWGWRDCAGRGVETGLSVLVS